MRMGSVQGDRRLTDEVEAEHCEGKGAEKGEHAIQLDKDGVQEGGDGRVEEDVEHDLEQPAEGQEGAHHPHGQLQPETQHSHGPHVPRVLSLQPQLRFCDSLKKASGL